jgi:hypothetical protein
MMEFSLEVVAALKRKRILFVPIPVIDDEDRKLLIDLLDTRLLELGAYQDDQNRGSGPGILQRR